MTACHSSRTILITGATDGIGLELARHYQMKGARLVLIGRRALDDLDGKLFDRRNYCRADLSCRDARARICSFLVQQDISQLDCVVHNAGTGWYGQVERQPAHDIRRVVDVNLWAPVALTHSLAPLLDSTGCKVVFIASIVASLACPDFAVYAATKAGIAAFARSLQVELAGRVRVQTILPGATRTGLHAKIGVPIERIDVQRFPSAESVAKKIAQAIDGNRRIATVGFGNRLISGLGNLAAAPVDWWMCRRQRLAAVERESHSREAPVSTEIDQPTGQSDAGRRCLITGAADGIGRALAHRFAAAGYAVIGVDRDEPRLHSTREEILRAGGHMTGIVADLALPQEITRVVDVLAAAGELECVIHNAGVNCVGRFTESDLEHQRAVLGVNLLAPMQLTAGLLDHRLLATRGTFVFISSLARFVSYPGAAVYAATKAALASYARSLSVALAPSGAHVLTVYPGPTRTAHARRYAPDNRAEHKRMPPGVVADAVFRAVGSRRRVLVPGTGNRMVAAIGQFFPRIAEYAMRHAILEKLDMTAKKPDNPDDSRT